MKVKASADVSNAKTDEELRARVTIALRDITQALNGKLSLTHNFTPPLVTATFLAANVDTTFAHGLGVVPAGFFPVSLSAAMTIYDGTKDFDDKNVYLRSSAAGVAKLWIF